MPPLPQLEISRAAPRHAAGLATLFGSNGYGCHCRFWHFGGDSRQWLERCALRPEENRAEMQSALRSGSPEMWGLVAEAAGDVVGWLKLAPALELPKLYDQRLYKGLPCLGGDRAGIFTVGCLLVREDVRRRGVARSLLSAAIERAPAWGARALEAFPRSDPDVADAALMLGPARLFIEAGFEVIHDFFPYPVLRRTLESAHAPR